MKDETRQQYEETVHQGKKSLMGVAELAQERGLADAEWKPLWDKLERVQRMLSLPTCETIDAFNILRPAMRGVNKLVGALTGTTPEDTVIAQEEAIANLPADSRSARVIKLIGTAEQALLQACELIMESHPALEQLPIVQEMKVLASKIKMYPKEISKLRGLG